jgi:hypothetical protein
LDQELGRGTSGPLAFYYFDKDNVAIEKRSDFGTMGEITEVKGDAFRLWMYGPGMKTKDVVKVALRLK